MKIFAKIPKYFVRDNINWLIIERDELGSEGYFLYHYKSIEEPCLFDDWFKELKFAIKAANEDFGVQEKDWKEFFVLNVRFKEFLESYFSDKEELNAETCLYHDLTIYGDDADEFLQKYSEIFNISIPPFQFADYFPYEGDIILPAIIAKLSEKRRKEYKRLTISQLQNSIETKILIL